jgi:hypothetical protein
MSELGHQEAPGLIKNKFVFSLSTSPGLLVIAWLQNHQHEHQITATMDLGIPARDK